MDLIYKEHKKIALSRMAEWKQDPTQNLVISCNYYVIKNNGFGDQKTSLVKAEENYTYFNLARNVKIKPAKTNKSQLPCLN